MNIAMWSGPRNLSTALMYSFGARGDCAVVDEPFYAAYLRESGSVHPMGDEILARQESDPDRVAALCAGPAPDGSPVFYQKQMAHHMRPGFDLAWMGRVRNVFLIRHPAHVIASYHVKRQDPTVEDIGAPQLTRLFERAAELEGAAPAVIDSADIRRAPEAALRALCARIGLAFDPAMMNWPAGGHPSDGVWAPHWYGAVHKSTGFVASAETVPQVPAHLVPVLDAALPDYEALRAHAIAVDAHADAD